MSTEDTTRILTQSQRGGVIFMTVIGVLSTLALIILLVHIISVSFLPLVISLAGAPSYSSSSGNTTSGDVANLPAGNGSGKGDMKAGIAMQIQRADSKTLGNKYADDLERAQAAAARKARARVSQLSKQKTKHNEERMFLRMQLGVFIVCMFLSDLIQSLGVLAQARWAHTGKVEPGRLCDFQAATVTFGDVATAVWNAVIAIHTFCTVVLGVRMSTTTVAVIVFCGWLFPIFMNVVGAIWIATPSRGNYYDVAGAWCFISNPYRVERVVLHYVPLLVSAGIITVMYTLVVLKMRGHLEITPISGFPWFTASFRRTRINTGASGNTNQKQVAYLRSLSLKMLWYPGAYICLVLPISICRMAELQGHFAPFPLLFFAMTLLFFVGLSNVAIYISTRNLGTPRRHVNIISTKANHHETQMEIYVDRVTQQDLGEVSSAISTHNQKMRRDRRSTLRFDEELGLSPFNSKEMVAVAKDDDSSRYSVDKDHPMAFTMANTPASSQLNHFESYVQSNESYGHQRRSSSHSHLRIQTGLNVQTVERPIQSHTSSLGSVTIERIGGPASNIPHHDAPFNTSMGLINEEADGPRIPPRSVTRDTFNIDTTTTSHPYRQASQEYNSYQPSYTPSPTTPSTLREAVRSPNGKIVGHGPRGSMSWRKPPPAYP